MRIEETVSEVRVPQKRDTYHVRMSMADVITALVRYVKVNHPELPQPDPQFCNVEQEQTPSGDVFILTYVSTRIINGDSNAAA